MTFYKKTKKKGGLTIRFGINALDEHAKHFASINYGIEMVFIENGNYVKHNRSIATEASLS
jgi:hypothetical protein